MARVSVTTCLTYSKVEVRKALEKVLAPFGGIDAFVKKGERVLLKPNLLGASPPERGVTTHPSVVEAVAEMVRETGGNPFIGDSPAIGPFRRVASKTGMEEVARRLSIPLVELKEEREIVSPEEFLFRRITLSREALEADKVINLPKLKTHSMMALTLGVKNLFGCVPGFKKASWHLKAQKRETFATLLLEIYLHIRPALTIADGIVAMEGSGPQSGDLRPLGLLAASEDAILLDAFLSRFVGLPPQRLPTLQAAKRKGIRHWEKDFSVIGGDPPPPVVLRIPPSANIGWGLPGLLKKPLRQFLLPRPRVLQDLCKRCGLCAEVCPPKAIRVEEKVKVNEGLCIRCYCCQEVCPEGAIQLR